MESSFQRIPGVLLLALAAAIPAAPAHAAAPACCTPVAPSCAGGYEQALADSSGNEFANSPFDLGEGAPAQSGYDLAINSAPNMIGDLLSSGGYILSTSTDLLTSFPIAGGDRRFKISENMSPLPRDRVFYAFNGFQQGARTIEGREYDVNRHTLGGEKTFLDGTASVEVRMPILQGLSAVQSLDGDLFNDDRVEFGNMTVIPKFIISDGPAYVLSAGLGINLPTARDSTIAAPGNSFIPTLNIDNQAVHLSPFLGLLVLPSGRTYVISYVQADFDTYGSTISDVNGRYLGSYQEQNLVHFDVAVGRFLYRDSGSRLSGITAQLELHYSTTIQDSDEVRFGTYTIGNPYNHIDLLIMTAGVNFQFWDSSWLTVGCAVPLSGEEQDPVYSIHPERPFDAEIQVLFNRYF